jgi:hypothetical protein
MKVLSGEGVVAKYTLVGRVDKVAGTPVADAGNTGNGTVGSVSLGSRALKGGYTINFKGSGAFHVLDPNGNRLEDGETGTAYSSKGVNFLATEGGTAWVDGDSFEIPVDKPSEVKVRVCKAGNTDGSQHPYGILSSDVDATSSDILASIYKKGAFNIDKVNIDSSLDSSDVKDELEKKCLFLVSIKS